MIATACHEVQRELGTQAPDDVRIYLLLYVYTIIQTAQTGAACHIDFCRFHRNTHGKRFTSSRLFSEKSQREVRK